MRAIISTQTSSIKRTQMMLKSLLHANSVRNPTAFWSEAAKDIDWIRNDDVVLDEFNTPFNKWFPSRTLNTCYNALDRHIKDRAQQAAIIYDSPVTDTIKSISYEELLYSVNSLSALLLDLGVVKGDRVIIYMPNIPEAVIAMLSCTRIGAVHSVVFGGFAAAELATRIKDSKPKVIIAASCGIDGQKVIAYKPLLDGAIDIARDSHVVEKCIILQRDALQASLLSSRDIEWAAGVKRFEGTKIPCTELQSGDASYILYTSGTTGAPKGVLRDTGGHAVALKWSMKHVYGMNPGDVFWAASDVGWVVGHSYSVYGPLLHGCTSILYEGKPVGTPDASAFWRVIEQHKVNALFTAPTAFRAIKRVDADGLLPKQFDLSSLKTVFLAGERADPDTVKWGEQALGVPLRDHWWQTETGWAICANLVGTEGYLPIKYGSAFRPCPGYNVQVLDDDHKLLPPGKLGSIAIKLPMPPGFMSTLYNNDKRFLDAYMTAIPGFYDTGDAGFMDEDNYIHVMSRTDDVINVAGHRLSTGAMEEVLINHHDVAEAAVVGIRDAFKGQAPLGLLLLNNNCSLSEEQVCKDVVRMVRERIGPVASFKKAVVVQRLPKTRSGKILRKTLRSIGNGEAYTIPATCEDPAVLEEIAAIIRMHENDVLE